MSTAERPGKTNIGTSHGQGQKVKVTRLLWLALYWQANMDVELVTDRYACMMYIVSPFACLGGGIGLLWRPPAYSLLLLLLFAINDGDVNA